jgi:hypothetical protein
VPGWFLEFMSVALGHRVREMEYGTFIPLMVMSSNRGCMSISPDIVTDPGSVGIHNNTNC